MKVFVCTDHDTVYPVGGASVVVAEDKFEAYRLLAEALEDLHLEPVGFPLQEIDLSRPVARILRDGNY